MYYEDLVIDKVVHRFFRRETLLDFVPWNNSIEFIRFGHILLKRTSDGSIIDLKAPVVFWMHKDVRYNYINKDPENTEKYTEHFFCDFVGERSERMLAALDELYPSGSFKPSSPDDVYKDFLRLLRLYRADWKINLPEIGFILEKLIFTAYDSSGNENSSAHDIQNLDRIAELLRSEPFQEYDFKSFAAEMDISYDHFRRIFRKKHRLTPREYLLHQRMFRAAELLKNDNMRIKEIVYSCNFKSLIDFSRIFKRYSGLSPREYRKRFSSGGAQQSDR